MLFFVLVTVGGDVDVVSGVGGGGNADGGNVDGRGVDVVGGGGSVGASVGVHGGGSVRGSVHGGVSIVGSVGDGGSVVVVGSIGVCGGDVGGCFVIVIFGSLQLFYLGNHEWSMNANIFPITGTLG